MSYYLIVFKNTHDAIAGEKVLLEKNYKIRMMPTPTVITLSCGICVRVEDKETIEKILKENFEYKNVYERNEKGFLLIK